jgi:hypothetical protein
MTQSFVRLTIPFETLLGAVSALDSAEKRILLSLLEADVSPAPEALLNHQPPVEAEVQTGHTGYQTDNYQILDQYLTLPSSNSL